MAKVVHTLSSDMSPAICHWLQPHIMGQSKEGSTNSVLDTHSGITTDGILPLLSWNSHARDILFQLSRSAAMPCGDKLLRVAAS